MKKIISEHLDGEIRETCLLSFCNCGSYVIINFENRANHFHHPNSF